MTFNDVLAHSSGARECTKAGYYRQPGGLLLHSCWNSMACVCLASFVSQARGIKFYGVSTSEVIPGMLLHCCLEPTNPYDGNSVALVVGPGSSGSTVLGHLVREDSQCLAPLLRKGFEATGWVLRKGSKGRTHRVNLPMCFSSEKCCPLHMAVWVLVEELDGMEVGFARSRCS